MAEKKYKLYGFHKVQQKDFSVELTVEAAKEFKAQHKDVVLFISKELRAVYKETA